MHKLGSLYLNILKYDGTNEGLGQRIQANWGLCYRFTTIVSAPLIEQGLEHTATGCQNSLNLGHHMHKLGSLYLNILMYDGTNEGLGWQIQAN